MNMRIAEISHSYEDYLYRTPIKFGGVVVDRVTLLNVDCALRTADGRRVKGFGSMPLGNVWAFPSKDLSYDHTLGAMKALAERIAKLTASHTELVNPIDANLDLEPLYLQAAAEVSKTLGLTIPIPKLCTLVTASPFDAALHDAYGKALRLNCYCTYGPDFLRQDLSHALGSEFKGDYLDRYISKKPKSPLFLYHLVGAVDPLVEADIKQRVNDGLPETLGEWISYDGLTHLKIKLNGDDLEWDVDRVLSVDRVATESESRAEDRGWQYSLDFNEKCSSVGYLLEFLHRIKEDRPAAFDRIQYVEQPTARDLEAHRENIMHEAAKLKPVVIDESLTSLDRLLLAREMGYTGLALKACKGQSQSLLMAAAGQRFRMFICVQDLTCPGASLIQSVGLAGHVPSVAAVEANSRQYVPAANKAWEGKFPGIFHITDGTLETNDLIGKGLGAVE
jgi:L-alanine-DL-glutamate epimerase-like enolase superfamily enzyme